MLLRRGILFIFVTLFFAATYAHAVFFRARALPYADMLYFACCLLRCCLMLTIITRYYYAMLIRHAMMPLRCFRCCRYAATIEGHASTYAMLLSLARYLSIRYAAACCRYAC